MRDPQKKKNKSIYLSSQTYLIYLSIYLSITSIQFKIIREKGISLNASSVEAQRDAKHSAFSKMSVTYISFSSKILKFLSIQITHNKDNTMHLHKTFAILLLPNHTISSNIKAVQCAGNTLRIPALIISAKEQ